MFHPRDKLFPKSMFKRIKKMFKMKFDFSLISRKAKTPIFSTVSFAAIFFLIYTDSLISNLTIYPPDLPITEILTTTDFSETMKQLQSTLRGTTDDTESEAVDPLIPPSNATVEQRMVWFRRKLPELEILHSNDLSQKFHGRVLEFYNNECTVQFFMIWFSPARTFGSREFLAMDTLFKTNPGSCLIILSRSMDSKQGYRILQPLTDLGFKILAVTPDLPFLVKNTPAEVWLDDMKTGNKDPGHVPLSVNLSNLIRVAMLYKYGGVYLDTDFIILRDFTGLNNAIGAQSINRVTRQWTRINGAVMIFDMNHPILADFQQEFAKTFNGNKWGHNGPYLLSRVIERVEGKPGYNLTILPPQAFYPVNWIKIHRLFQKPGNENETTWVEETVLGLTQSYALHLWNKKTRDLIIEDGSVMDRLISDNCVVCQHIYHA